MSHIEPRERMGLSVAAWDTLEPLGRVETLSELGWILDGLSDAEREALQPWIELAEDRITDATLDVFDV